MAKKSMVARDAKRRKLANKFEAKRTALKAIIRSEEASGEDKFKAVMTLAELPRNSSPTRIRNRCMVTGRPRGYYRKLKMSRIALRELGSAGLIPGLVKSSW